MEYDEFGNPIIAEEQNDATSGGNSGGEADGKSKTKLGKFINEAKETVTKTADELTKMVAEATDNDGNGRKEIQIPIPEEVEESKIAHFIAGAVEKGAKLNPLYQLLGYEIDVTVTSAPEEPEIMMGVPEEPEEISLVDQGYPSTTITGYDHVETLEEQGYPSTLNDYENNADGEEEDELDAEETVPLDQKLDDLPGVTKEERPLPLGAEMGYLWYVAMEDPEWASLHYSSSNYATAGCSAASLAIALNAIEDGYYFTAEDIGNMVYGENSLGKSYVGADGIVDKAEFFEDQLPLENIGVTEVVQISKKDDYNPDEIEMLKRHLENGGVALILTDATTKFTKKRHYVAATDINEDGEIQIADPNYSNETREDKLKTRAVDNYTIGKGEGFDVNPEGFLNITLIFTEESGTFEELLDSFED